MRAVTKMSAMRGVVHVGILLDPILIIGVSISLSKRLNGIEGILLEMRIRLPCLDCFSAEQDEDPYTAHPFSMTLCKSNCPV